MIVIFYQFLIQDYKAIHSLDELLQKSQKDKILSKGYWEPGIWLEKLFINTTTTKVSLTWFEKDIVQDMMSVSVVVPGANLSDIFRVWLPCKNTKGSIVLG